MATYQEVPSQAIHAGQTVTSLSFDPVADTLWTGLNNGTIVARHNAAQPFRGVTFPVGGKYPVTKISVGESYVRALGAKSGGIGSWAKGGTNKWFYHYTPTDPSSPSSITTFSSESNSAQHLALASTASELILIDSITGKQVRRVSSPSMITHLKFSHSLLLSGSFDGSIRLHDPRTGLRDERDVAAPVRSHRGSIQGLQCAGSYVFSIGYGQSDRRPVPDKFVKVYDMRTLKPLPLIPLDFFPAFLHAIPRKPASVCVASNQGLVNITDVRYPDGSKNEFYHLSSPSSLTSSAISPTGAYIAFGDTDGTIHMLSAAAEATGTTLPFNGFEGQPAELPDAPDVLPEIEWNDSTPLNSIGLPYYTAPLLSSWSHRLGPSKNVGTYFPPPPKIPLQVLNTMKVSGNIAYATLPKELRGRRNVVVLGKGAKGGHGGGGKFRSEKMKAEEASETSSFENFNDLVPKIYRHVEIEYSKFGVEDFDFASFNITPYSGLETHILNSYTNCILQVLHHTRALNHLAQSHIAMNCEQEYCLLCELGFVVRMLEDSKGRNCQASNFCRAIGVLAQKIGYIELVDYGKISAETDYTDRIQRFHRFLLDHLCASSVIQPQNPAIHRKYAQDNNENSLVPPPITQLLGVLSTGLTACMNCKAERKKANITHIVDLVYPMKTSPTEQKDFASVVKASLLRYQTYKSPCQACKQQSGFLSYRSIASKDLPPILALNTCCHNTEIMKTWWLDGGKTKFLPRGKIQVRGQVRGVDDKEVIEYEIKAIVAEIKGKSKPPHLVSIVRVPGAELSSDIQSPWFVFNDFVVTNVSEDEALSFPGTWKIPAIIYLQRVGIDDILDFSSLPDKLDPAILCKDTSISENRDMTRVEHELLGFDELPKPGNLVAIDAEFVLMQQEEVEYKSDGTKKVIRPARLGLARVSVLRGSGDKMGIPFIDDHIHTSEAIVDYLTEFSGIKYGDLDPRISPYTLTRLKTVYKKLRLLVDAGCIFIGHGLSKDFRIINIHVPPGQVLDTVDIYYLESRQRRLSLKFLAWFILEERIQGDMHDSIEDARTALMLYRQSRTLKSEATWRDKLVELYKAGRVYQWKPPPSPDVPNNADATISLSNAEIRAQRSMSLTPVSRFNARAAGSAYPSSLSSSPIPVRFSTPPYQQYTGPGASGSPEAPGTNRGVNWKNLR